MTYLIEALKEAERGGGWRWAELFLGIVRVGVRLLGKFGDARAVEYLEHLKCSFPVPWCLEAEEALAQIAARHGLAPSAEPEETDAADRGATSQVDEGVDGLAAGKGKSKGKGK